MIALALLVASMQGPPALPDDSPEPEQAAIGLRWEAPAQCEGASSLSERLAELLPELPVRDDGGILVLVRLTAVAGGWSVVVELDSELGVDRREFVAESCPVAIDASALVIAVALDPITATQELERIRESQPEPDPDPVPVPEPDPEPTTNFTITSEPPDEPPRPGRLRAGLAVLGGGGYGPLQSGSGILEARVALIGRAWRASLRGGYLPPIVHEVGDARQIRVDGWLIGARGCGVPRRKALEFPLCAGIEAGAVRGSPLEPIANPRDASQPWVAAELGPGLRWAPRPRLALGLEIAAVVPFVTAGFALDGQRVLGFSPVGVRALAGIELRLP